MFNLHYIDQKNLEKALKDRPIECDISKVVVQGPARVGKTSVKCLILATNYKSPNSTGCVHPTERTIGNFKISAHARHDGKHWELVDDNGMEDKLASVIKAAAENQADKKHTTNSTAEDTQQMSADDDVIALDNYTSVSSKSPSFQSTFEERDVKEAQEMVKAFLLLAEKADGNLKFHEDWLYFIDCGGQIQYQKLIQTFIPCASVLMLVTSLAEELSSQSSTQLQFGDPEYETSKYSLTVETILKQLILMVNYNTHQQKMLISEDKSHVDIINPPEKLSIIVVATHSDEYKEDTVVETIEMKEKKLAEIFKPWESNLSYHETDTGLRIMHIVDGSRADCAESIVSQDPIISEISRKLKDQAYKVQVPIRWYAFELLLRKLAKRGCGVLSLQKCKAVGRALKLNVHDGEVESALQFFHILNTLLYYPDSSVTDLVFVFPESLIKIIDELMIHICQARVKRSVSSAINEMAIEGIISKTVLDLTCKCREISAEFPDFKAKLFAIFKHLLIASELPEQEDKFFMPALLPLVDPLQMCFFPDSTFCPLVFSFEKGAPAGLFCSWIVQLLSSRKKASPLNRKLVWHISHLTDTNYSNFIKMTCVGCTGKVAFVERFDRFEVYCESSEDQLKVGREVENALECTIEIRKFEAIIRSKNWFLCPCGQTPDHFAEASIDFMNDGKVVCSNTHDILEAPPECVSWIMLRKGEFPDNNNNNFCEYINFNTRYYL